MGGMITIMARYKNEEVIAFKTNTNFFHYNLNSPHLLNEEEFKKSVIKYDFLRDAHLPEEEVRDYENRKGIKAPYDYGLILIDYFNKTLLSCNNYSGMVRGNSCKLLEEYLRFLPSDFILKVTSYNDNNQKETKKVDVKENRFMDYQEVHLIHQALKNKATIKIKDEIVKHDGTIESVLDFIYKVDLSGKSKEEQISILEEKNKTELARSYSSIDESIAFNLDNYGDITFEYPDFTIIEGENAKDIHLIWEYVNKNGFVFTEYEMQDWNNFLTRSKK